MLCMIAVPQEIKVFISKKKSKAHTHHMISPTASKWQIIPLMLNWDISIDNPSLDCLSKGTEGYLRPYDSVCHSKCCADTKPFLHNHLLKFSQVCLQNLGFLKEKNLNIGKINDKEYLGFFLSILKAKYILLIWNTETDDNHSIFFR